MKSLSERETTSKRATRAAGFSWGISEEVGKCIRLLELFGLPGIKNLNSYFKEKNLSGFESLKSIEKENKPQKKTFCPIHGTFLYKKKTKKKDAYQVTRSNL